MRKTSVILLAISLGLTACAPKNPSEMAMVTNDSADGWNYVTKESVEESKFIIITTEDHTVQPEITGDAPSEITEEKPAYSFEIITTSPQTTTTTTAVTTTEKKVTTKAVTTRAAILSDEYIQVTDVKTARSAYKKQSANYITDGAAELVKSGNTAQIVFVSVKSATTVYHYDKTCSKMTLVVALSLQEAEDLGFTLCKKEHS
jgi:uncharacterized protein YegJ (DUF2314 family)